eukprot:m.32678 g.32678  ORF g.32678 m.32678 type:complete len:106 (-) comp16678_c1_seq1:239-556(-)
MAEMLTSTEVAAWVTEQGFPTYTNCFTSHFIDGGKLKLCDGAKLAQLGVRDFKDNQRLAACIRDLYNERAVKFSDSVADFKFTPKRTPAGCVEGYAQAPFPDPKP